MTDTDKADGSPGAAEVKSLLDVETRQNGVKTASLNETSNGSTSEPTARDGCVKASNSNDGKTRRNNGLIFKTLCLYSSFATLGLCAPLLGTTIVHMEKLFDSDTATMAWTFTVDSVGYLIGSVICGFIYDRFNHELLFAGACLIEALATIVAPFSGNFYAFSAILSVQGLAQGFIDAGGQSYCVSLWDGRRQKEPVLQAAHALWSLGAAIGPFIIGAFLVDLSHVVFKSSEVNVTTSESFNVSSGQINAEVLATADYNSSYSAVTVSSTDLPPNLSDVRYAYVAIGSLIIISSLLFLVAYCRDISVRRAERRCKPPTTTTAMNTTKETALTDAAVAAPAVGRKGHRCLRLSFIALLFAFFHVYAYIELIPNDYFATFSIKFLHWPVHKTSLLMSVFFGSHFVGRLLSVPLSAVMRPRTMLAINISLTAAAYLLLVTVASFPPVMWLSAALAGAAMASTFPAAILWASETIEVTGKVSSVILVGSSTGTMISPLIVGRLFDAVSPMCMVAVLIAASVVHIALFIVDVIFVKRCSHRLALTPPTSLTIEVTEQ